MKNVTDRFERLVIGYKRDTVVVLNVGTNDIEQGSLVELVNRYKEMLQNVRESRRKCVMFGVLPQIRIGKAWLS